MSAVERWTVSRRGSAETCIGDHRFQRCNFLWREIAEGIVDIRMRHGCILMTFQGWDRAKRVEFRHEMRTHAQKYAFLQPFQLDPPTHGPRDGRWRDSLLHRVR